METTRQKTLYALLVALCCLVSVYRVADPGGFAERLGVVPPGPQVTVGGTTWHRLVDWDFRQGDFPDAWGWGEYRIRDGVLEMEDLDGDYTVYFTPVDHGGDFILETELQIEPGPGPGPSEAHLITRDSNRLASECGIAVYGGDDHGYLRNTVDNTDHLQAVVGLGQWIDFDRWYAVRLQMQAGRLAAWIDGVPVDVPDGEYPAAFYGEPHFAVRNGTARFRNLVILSDTPYLPLPGRHQEDDLVAGLTRGRRSTAGIVDGAARAGAGGPLARLGAVRTAGAALPSFASPSLTLRAPLLPTPDGWLVRVCKAIFYVIIVLIVLYVTRHFVFTINRLTGDQRHPYLDIDCVEWPEVTVLIPAHDEENVIGEILEALLEVDYPADRLRILPVNDRSRDDTAAIIDRFAAAHPGRITPFHRSEGQPGKAAALKDAMERVHSEFVLVFDADYIPGRGLIKQLMAPFFDPEVGAVMGRVVPRNVQDNLLTRMLDLERSGGYQVDQQARMNLHLVPQYGGTVGGLRVAALESVGGWRTDSLAEDTDATYRLLLGGWKTIYQNRSECYEQVPDTWRSRMSQIFRWTLGHNQTLVRYFFRLWGNRRTRWLERVDGALLLGIYWMSPLMLLGWIVGSTLWYLGINKPGLIIILAVTCYSTVGNFAVFFEIATAAHLDGTRGRIKLLPFVLMGFLVSLVSVTRASFTQLLGLHGRDGVFWHKTQHGKRRNEWA